MNRFFKELSNNYQWIPNVSASEEERTQYYSDEAPVVNHDDPDEEEEPYSEHTTDELIYPKDETFDEENHPLLIQYGSIARAKVKHEGTTDEDENIFDAAHEDDGVAFHRYRSRRSWTPLTLALVVFCGLLLTSLRWTSNNGTTSVTATTSTLDMLMAPLLGKTKESKTEKKEGKAAKKKAKQAKKAAEKKAKEEAKEEAKEAKEAKKKAKEFVPSTYPGCPAVNVTYIQTPLTWIEHEDAAVASNCHLASIHDLAENTKLSSSGLFEMTPGPEVGMSFATGIILSKDFYLGGFVNDTLDWEWIDGSDWDYGPNTTGPNATAGLCLQSSVNFTEIMLKNISYVNHWKTADCSIPLPAIYKCCLSTPAPSMAPSEDPTTNPTATPTIATESPTSDPTISPTVSPTVATPAPSLATSSPTAVTPAPTVTTPSPTVATPAPTIATAAPSIATATPTMETPAPSLATPLPTKATPAVTMATPAPVVVTASPTQATPAPTKATTSPTTVPLLKEPPVEEQAFPEE